jgi:tripartite motif-containing protein 71
LESPDPDPAAKMEQSSLMALWTTSGYFRKPERRTDRPRTTRRLAWLIIAVLGSGLIIAAGSADAESGADDVTFRFGPYRGTLADLESPAAVTIDGEGRIHVAEAFAARISIFDHAGKPLGSIGGDGPALIDPSGIAVDEEGRVLVTDAGGHCVCVIAADGARLATWGGRGAEPGRFNEPRGIALGDERVYVADAGNHRVQVFDREGEPQFAIGSFGHEDGAFNRPVDVAVDDDGFIYVADANNDRIQKFDGAGSFITSWGDWGPFAGLMDEPTSVVCQGERVYVTDRRNHRVQFFEPDGKLIGQWGVHAVQPREGKGKVHYPNDLAIAPDGSFAVVCESFEDRCQIFEADPTGEDTESAPPMPPSRTKAHFGRRIAVAGDLLALAEPEMHRIHIFETTREIPIIIGTFGERGRGFGLFLRIAGLALDADAPALYIGDTATHRCQRYDIDYSPDEPRGFSTQRARLGRSYDFAQLAESFDHAQLDWPIEPGALRLGPDGELLVVDQRNCLIHIFDRSMKHIRSFGGFGSGDGRFRRPVDLAFSQDGGTIYVLDSYSPRVQAFDHDGTFQFAFGGENDDEDRLERPFGITAGVDGHVYITDEARHRVCKFTESGSFVQAWGRKGIDHGEFWKPKGIGQDRRGRVYVVDHGNHRAQIFSPDGEWLVTFGTGRAYTRRNVPRSDREDQP